MKKIILLILSLFVFSCDSGGGTAEVEGCTDDTACNYDETSTIDNGTCIFDLSECILGTWLLIGGVEYLDENCSIPEEPEDDSLCDSNFGGWYFIFNRDVFDA